MLREPQCSHLCSLLRTVSAAQDLLKAGESLGFHTSTLFFPHQAFLVVGPAVAAFPEFRGALAQFLAGQQLRHWEATLRALAARALGALVATEPLLFAGTMLDGLLPLCLDPALEVEQSVLHCLGVETSV